MEINPAAILALISGLYEQLAQAREEIARLRAALADASSNGHAPAPKESAEITP